MEIGYIQIYTGNGKGKTTAALGQAFRAIGRGMKVIMIQFLKGMPTGELISAKQFGAAFEIYRFEKSTKFFWQMTEEEKESTRQEINAAVDFAIHTVNDESCDILILDEIMGAIHAGMVDIEKVLLLIQSKPVSMELIMTGRNVPEKIAELADLITEMKPVKHYFDKGVGARIGIES